MSDIEYKLKILLKSTTLQVTSIKDISDGASSASFNKKYGTTRKIHAFIKNSSSLAKTNIEVPVFSTPLNYNELKHKLIYCEVAVGSSMFVTKDYAMMCQPPSSFDSFIVKDESKLQQNDDDRDVHNKYDQESNYENNNYLDDNYRKEMKNINNTYLKEMTIKEKGYRSDRESRNTSKMSSPRPPTPTSSKSPAEDLSTTEMDLTSFNYIIKDPSKVNMLYEVSFNYDRMLEQKQKGQCEMCQKNPAIMFCLAERASFCKYCEEGIHDNEFTRRHQRYYYDTPDKKKKFISCAFHYDSIVDFYCEVCNAPVCSLCKIHGNHSSPPFSGHKLIKFLDACDIIKEKMAFEESELCTISDHIRTNIQIFRADLEEFNKMVNLTRNKIESEYRNAVNELNCIVRKRFQIYNAIYIEKSIALERCERIHNYIKESEGGQNVKDYKTILEQKEIIKVKDERLPIEKIVMEGYLNLYSSGKERNDKKDKGIRNNNEQYVETKSAK